MSDDQCITLQPRGQRARVRGTLAARSNASTARSGGKLIRGGASRDSLELRRARYGTSYNVGSSGSDYEITTLTVVPFLIANGVRVARLVWENSGRVPEKTPGTAANQTNVAVAQLHVILELSDHLGSTSLSIDRATSELTSRSSYQAYGASEADYRPTRWNSFREDYKFTGKEEDAEIGLTYFGKRYLNAYLGRWISADPLAIHAPGEADLNVYAYVSGAVLKNVDPLGLEETAPVERFLVIKGEQLKGWVGTAKNHMLGIRDVAMQWRSGESGRQVYDVRPDAGGDGAASGLQHLRAVGSVATQGAVEGRSQHLHIVAHGGLEGRDAEGNPADAGIVLGGDKGKALHITTKMLKTDPSQLQFEEGILLRKLNRELDSLKAQLAKANVTDLTIHG